MKPDTAVHPFGVLATSTLAVLALGCVQATERVITDAASMCRYNLYSIYRTDECVLYSCDAGYGNADCVPIDPLPQHLVSHFDGEDSSQIYLSGASISSSCGVLMSGPAAIFHHVQYNLFITRCILKFNIIAALFLKRTACGTSSPQI